MRHKRGQARAVLPPLVVAKLAVYEAMRDAGLSQQPSPSGSAVIRGRCGGCSISTTARVSTSSRQRSAHLGNRLVLEVRDAA